MHKNWIQAPTKFPVDDAGILNALESDPSVNLPISASPPKLLEKAPEIAVPDEV